MKSIKQLAVKYRKSISYILFSCLTAVIELIIGLICINLFGLSDVVSNTIGVIIGASIHYVLVTDSVFNSSKNIKTVAVYIITFLMGLLLQNAVVYIVGRLLKNAIGRNAAYTISKAASLVISFVLMYQCRKILYSKIGDKKDE